MQQYHAAIVQLIRQQLANGHSVPLQVSSPSMLPILRPGDTVQVVAARPHELVPGDLVTYQAGEALYTHRLLAEDDGLYQTRGDNLFYPDRPVPYAAIVGRVALVQRGTRSLNLQATGWLPHVRLQAAISRRVLAVYRWRQAQARRSGALTIIMPGELVRLLVRAVNTVLLEGLLLWQPGSRVPPTGATAPPIPPPNQKERDTHDTHPDP